MINNCKSFLNILLIAVSTTITATAVDSEFRIVGYFANWNNVQPMAKSFDYSKVTHLNYCFVNVTDTIGTLDGMDANLDTLVKYAHASGVKVLISMGGGEMSALQISNYFYQIKTVSRRARFINKITNYLDQYHLDGFDVDIEGPRINGDYGAFISQLSDSLNANGKLMTAALGDWGGENVPEEVIPLFDFINIMAYDATGDWDQNNVGQHSSFELAQQSIEKWVSRGALRENLSVGLPFYGYAFNSLQELKFSTYSTILSHYPDAYDQDTVGDIILYNGISTIQRKTCLALEKAGGVMIWELAYDVTGEHSLLKAINDAIGSYRSSDLAPVAHIVLPAYDTTITENGLSVSASSSDSDGSFRKISALIGNVFISESNDSLATFHFNNLESGTYPIIIEAIDHQFRAGRDTLNITINPVTARSSFNGNIIELPGKIEAEHYDAGGQDITYHDASATNEGKSLRMGRVDIEPCYDSGSGFDIAWTASGEWIEYTVNIEDSGYFDIDFRAATPNSNRTVSAELDGTEVVTNFKLTKTGGWQVWNTSTAKGIYLPKGEHVLRLKMNAGGFNLNYMIIKPGVPNSIGQSEKQTIQLFPNPTNNTLFIKLYSELNGEVEIFNIAGQSVHKEVYANNSGAYTELNIASLASGVYRVRIQTNDINFTSSFIKN